ncbi:MAG: SRPBCC family protein [Actinomycetes bacterium]
MNRVTVETTIARPREEVYDYLVDISNMSEYTDHFLSGWHLTRENPRGKGSSLVFWKEVGFPQEASL